MLEPKRNTFQAVGPVGAEEEQPATIVARYQRLRSVFGALDGLELLQAMHAEFGPRIAIVSSFGAHSAVILDMAARIDPTMAVIFLQTGKLFAETLEYRRMLARKLGLANVREVEPSPAAVQDADPHGSLWRADPDACCALRKVAPLDAALVEFDAWVTGRKRYQGGERMLLPTIELSAGKIKLNPLATWSSEQVQAYLTDRDLPSHPLYGHGYLSLGCVPCTRRVEAGQLERDGRWPQHAKTECGIHRPYFDKDY